MSIQISRVVKTDKRGDGDQFAVKSIDVNKLGPGASPIALLDDFFVKGRPFGPHPHAGFSQLTYVFEDSRGGVRSRDSLGNDIVVGPGGIVWTQAGRGMLHQEVPADPVGGLHGLQVFVNLSARNKLITPQVFHLSKESVPEWKNDAGDRVRVVTGTFSNIASPLVPAEPCTFLDVELRREIEFDLVEKRNALVYVLTGDLRVSAGNRERLLHDGSAVAIYGDSGCVTFTAERDVHFVLLSGIDLREPALAQGPFIMNSRSEIEDAYARFRTGGMGRLEALPTI